MAADDTSPDWRRVAEAYMRGQEPVHKICARFGITATRLYRQARREGWPRRSKRSGRRKQARASKNTDNPEAPRPDKAPSSQNREKSQNSWNQDQEILLRLYRALERKLSRLEMQDQEGHMPDTPPPSAADTEREARTLSALVRLFEKLTEIDARLARPRPEDTADEATKGGRGDKPAGNSDASDPAEQLRKELAARIARLQGSAED